MLRDIYKMIFLCLLKCGVSRNRVMEKSCLQAYSMGGYRCETQATLFLSHRGDMVVTRPWGSM